MKRIEKIAGGEGAVTYSAETWSRIAVFLRELRRFYRAYAVVLFVFLAATVALYVFDEPDYTAQAIVGAPAPSPTSLLMQGVNGSSLLGSLTSKLTKASGAGGDDTFTQFRQTLTSARLAADLVQKDNVLPVVFSHRWDAQNHRWKPHSIFHTSAVAVEKMLNRPVSEQPDRDMLQVFLKREMDVSDVIAPGARQSIIGGGGSYITVSVELENRDAAIWLLKTILNRADEIIREDELRDVQSRIAYIQSQLPNVTQTDERATLIQILSSQEQLRIMLIADKRYASNLIDPPDASQTPSWPPPPLLGFAAAVLLSLAAWAGLVAIGSRWRIAQRLAVPRKGQHPAAFDHNFATR